MLTTQYSRDMDSGLNEFPENRKQATANAAQIFKLTFAMHQLTLSALCRPSLNPAVH